MVLHRVGEGSGSGDLSFLVMEEACLQEQSVYARQTWVESQAHPHNCCLSLDKLYNFSHPYCPQTVAPCSQYY